MRNDLYPAIEPFNAGMMPLDMIHTMYWEQCGNPRGIPVVFLHGGPGAGASPTHRRFFDPAHYRIIIFDQRGAGRSTPLAEIRENSTVHLLDDIERLRRFLGIEAWLVFGGSWGSTLALAYAQTHPERCLGLILRGIFLARPKEIEWFLYGMRTVFPEAWRDLTAVLEPSEHRDILGAFWRRLSDPRPSVHLPAARVWSRYEGSCSTLLPNPETSFGLGDDRVALGLARLEAHYFLHDRFLQEHDLLTNIALIRHIPTTIVQGRYDMICPMTTADDLARSFPEARFVIVPDGGHSALEPGIRAALVAATERFKEQHRVTSAAQ